MRRSVGVLMLAAGLVVVALGIWLLLRPGASGAANISAQPVVITPNFTRLTSQPVAQAAPPTRLAIAPAAPDPAMATAVVKPASPQAEVPRISPVELQRRLGESNPPLVWEIRTADQYEKQHIPGSQLVKLGEITAMAQNLDRGQAIVTSCD